MRLTAEPFDEPLTRDRLRCAVEAAGDPAQQRPAEIDRGVELADRSEAHEVVVDQRHPRRRRARGGPRARPAGGVPLSEVRLHGRERASRERGAVAVVERECIAALRDP